MLSLLNKPSKFAACSIVFSFFAASTMAFAQDAVPPPAPDAQAQQEPAPPATHGWPRASDQPADSNQNAQSNSSQDAPAPAYPPAPPPQEQQQPSPYPAPNGNGYPAQQQGAYPPPNAGAYPPPNTRAYPPPQQQPNYGPNPYSAPPPIPAQLTITPGTYVTVRVNQVLSSEHNQKGDAFAATLVQPVVVDGVVVAEPGQTLGGQVAESQRSGRVQGVARLGVVLTDLTLTDGQRLPVQTQLIARKAPSTVGRDAGAIAGTTALGAAIGAAANWGTGAAVGAGAGLLLGTLGVLVTKGAPSVIYPEQVLTFRIETPVTFSTATAPQAFHWVEPGEYDRPVYNQEPRPRVAYATPSLYAPYPYPYPGYYYNPYWYGPSVGFYFGRGYYGRGYYGGYRGFYGGRGYYHHR